MINAIIDGISNALDAEFEGVDISSESIEQGFKEPCFFIMTLNALETPLLGVRARRIMHFDVHYHPKNETNEEMQSVAQRLYPLLRRITLLDGTMLNGLELHHEIVDGVLHFFVQYKPTIRYQVDETVPMGDLDYTSEIKE